MVKLEKMDMSVSIGSESANATITYISNVERLKTPFTDAYIEILDHIRKKLLLGLYERYIGTDKENYLIMEYDDGFVEMGYITFKHNASCLIEDVTNPLYAFRICLIISKKGFKSISDREWINYLQERLSAL